jgi:hemolysin activation/secretion protein
MIPGELRERSGEEEPGRQPFCRRLAGSAPRAARVGARSILLALGCVFGLVTSLAAAEPAAGAANTLASAGGSAKAGGEARFDVRTYIIKRDGLIFTNAPSTALSDCTGTNLSTDQIVQAATELLWEYKKQGYPKANVSLSRERITNGVVTMHIYQGAFPQVWISGKPCFSSSNTAAAAISAAEARATGSKASNPQRFSVRAYEIRGDTLLSTNTLMSIFAKQTGTNMTLTNILQAASDLQMEYRLRRYPTVSVAVPQQDIGSNGIVKIHVFQGRLSEINVTGNRYFSSNNVVRQLPSLHTNMILNDALFQAELDRANASQDRQIYPKLEPGLEENTTALDLEVKDRFPLHGKTELNNLSSPGTPELRENSSAVYNNLWQLEHSIGLQYSFSPEDFKGSDSWALYDKPLVANYSAFYRMPLASPEPIAEQIANQPGSFGYDEATRRFHLPPPSGVPELNIYASRSTIDTGVNTLSSTNVTDVPGVLSINRVTVQQDVTVNNALGSRLSVPVREIAGIRSTVSGGLDYKQYSTTLSKTNNFATSVITIDPFGNPLPPENSLVSSAVPTTYRSLDYLPVTLRYDGSRPDKLGTAFFGLGLSVNTWFSGSGPYGGTNHADSSNTVHGLAALQGITSSTQSSGYWVTLTPSLSHDFMVWTNWTLSVRADGQWASEPLISNEQFGVGGVASVRGYHEGEIFGDNGWHVSVEQKTPPCLLGLAYPNHPLVVRGSVYMDYGEAYLIDPQGRDSGIRLWGTGFGGVMSLGATWEARFLFTEPLRNAGTVGAYHPFCNFSLSAQF